MFDRPWRGTCSLIALALTVEGPCGGGGIGPGRLAPSYVLFSEAGQVLPIERTTSDDEEGHRMVERTLGRTLDFGPDDEVLLTHADDRLVITLATHDTAATVICRTSSGTYRRSGGFVIIEWAGPSRSTDTLQLVADAGVLQSYDGDRPYVEGVHMYLPLRRNPPFICPEG
jgi:hypothetical protein